MDDRAFSHLLEQALGRGRDDDRLSSSVAFRESLLERCLALLGADDVGEPLDEGDLELLSAVGDLTPPFFETDPPPR